MVHHTEMHTYNSLYWKEDVCRAAHKRIYIIYKHTVQTQFAACGLHWVLLKRVFG